MKSAGFPQAFPQLLWGFAQEIDERPAFFDREGFCPKEHE